MVACSRPRSYDGVRNESEEMAAERAGAGTPALSQPLGVSPSRTAQSLSTSVPLRAALGALRRVCQRPTPLPGRSGFLGLAIGTGRILGFRAGQRQPCGSWRWTPSACSYRVAWPRLAHANGAHLASRPGSAALAAPFGVWPTWSLIAAPTSSTTRRGGTPPSCRASIRRMSAMSASRWRRVSSISASMRRSLLVRMMMASAHHTRWTRRSPTRRCSTRRASPTAQRLPSWRPRCAAWASCSRL